MQFLHRLALRLRARATHVAYLRRERALAQPESGARALSILFTRRATWDDALREGFRGLPHHLHFDDLRQADLERHDLIVPLSLDDARFLRDQPPHVRDRVLPLPDEDCTALCHDKPRLNRFLAEAGFAACIPPMGNDVVPPYVCKPARGENSDDCVLVPDGATEVRLADQLSRPGLFRQAAVPGRVEHATHFLMRDGQLVRELTVRYHHASALYIKDPVRAPALARSLGPCDDPATLESMLRAVGYDGVGCANYKLLRGRLQLLEINPRMGGSLCPYFFSFLRSLPRTRRSQVSGCTNWTWLESLVDRDSSARDSSIARA